MTRQSNYKL